MRGSVVLLDEASMVGNADKEKLVRLANLLELGRFASIGDRKQLGAVDAGKPFDIMQRAGVETAAMDVNVRARDVCCAMRRRRRRAAASMRRCDISAPVPRWRRGCDRRSRGLTCSVAGRKRADGDLRVGALLRSEVNDAVQIGLKAKG